MRNSIAGTWVYATVLVFMVVLIAYVTITINYSNAYEISENIIKSIEEYEGINTKSLNKIGNLMATSHTTKGNCEKDESTFGIIGKTAHATTTTTGPYDVCVTRSKQTTNGVTKYYYNTTIFFSFSLPVLGDIFKFKIPCETMGMRYTTDTVSFKD